MCSACAAANADGVWNDNGLAIPVRVAAAPWNTLTARAIYAALALSLIGYLWILHRRRVGEQERRKRQLEVMVADRTRELKDRNEQLQVLARAEE